MNPVFAAKLFALLVAIAALFHLVLAAGAPWGEFAWGGSYPGTLPDSMRIASVASAILLLVFGFIVLVRAGLAMAAWQPAARKAIWGVVAYCVLGVIANAITPSVMERAVWLPVTLLLLVCSLTVARNS